MPHLKPHEAPPCRLGCGTAAARGGGSAAVGAAEWLGAEGPGGRKWLGGRWKRRSEGDLYTAFYICVGG